MLKNNYNSIASNSCSQETIIRSCDFWVSFEDYLGYNEDAK